MLVERRERAIAIWLGSTGNGRSPIVQWKAAAFVRWHEPDDARVSSPVVCPAKAGWFSRGQTCRGNSQAPRSLDSRVAGNQDSEAYRQGLPWGDHESPGRNKSERASGLENEWIRGPSLQLKGEGSMGCRNLTDAAPHLGGVEATARWQGHAEQLEKPSSSRREITGAR
jgi:hypothetical protein